MPCNFAVEFPRFVGMPFLPQVRPTCLIFPLDKLYPPVLSSRSQDTSVTAHDTANSSAIPPTSSFSPGKPRCDNHNRSDAISVTTTPRKSPQLAVAGPYDLESPQLPPTIKNKLLAQPPVSLMTLFKSNVPRPDHIQPPAKGVTPEGYYVVWVGQEVGIFYTW
ncbi:hypothetical protein SERLADRAFT_406237 [Serpula lacrymans var. lacrymans S7.9]|uniref:Uncharacterized protein n=1 Tax=Serpula lacrymans var. lacrymans (strain S7.9) TaxID=578457 RepID=F8NKY7_SERL9|nr:uncharacterized protein SERLADRAFT_406237 [Serpula lacrymans var. lacrymans S7.9]EGO28856.1 hypothetical protein SERLADRAFT_406237 [Serpula lacrymans var. lacrymans S7.9]